MVPVPAKGGAVALPGSSSLNRGLAISRDGALGPRFSALSPGTDLNQGLVTRTQTNALKLTFVTALLQQF
eukprot:780389-Pyramimonas_sp.AAC.1